MDKENARRVCARFLIDLKRALDAAIAQDKVVLFNIDHGAREIVLPQFGMKIKEPDGARTITISIPPDELGDSGADDIRATHRQEVYLAAAKPSGSDVFLRRIMLMPANTADVINGLVMGTAEMPAICASVRHIPMALTHIVLLLNGFFIVRYFPCKVERRHAPSRLSAPTGETLERSR